MTRLSKPIVMLALALGMGLASPVLARSPELDAAVSSGAVGEQDDGYMGVAGQVSDVVRKEVESINIKRRQVYTNLAGKRGVTVQDAAAATACQTLTRMKAGHAYRVGGAAWQIKSGPIALPSYCANAG